MIAVIGDIHGCYHTLIELYNKIIEKYPDIKIYCVGDLVDRGKFSYEVVKFFMENQQKIKFTLGNHDIMFYEYVKDPNSFLAKAWVFNGSESTLSSYLNHAEDILSHVNFLKNAAFCYNLDECFISHAGISSNFKLDVNLNNPQEFEIFREFIKKDIESESSIIWTRDKLKNIGKLQVVGHTRQGDVRIDKIANAVYIDTGACLGRKLSCTVIETNNVTDIISEKTHSNDLTK